MRGWHAGVAIALLAATAGSAGGAELERRIGRAYDAGTGRLLYEERHLETREGGEVIRDVVRYVDPHGREFAVKRVEFRPRPHLPAFVLSDRRTGHIEALEHLGETAGGAVTVRFRRRAGESLREARLEPPAQALADAGFDRFIESHWDALLDGRPVVRRFLIPSRLDLAAFRIRRVGDGDEAPIVAFALEIDSALLRLVVPRVVVTYDARSRRLLSYEGPSNLRDERGENLEVRIEFDYGATGGGEVTSL